MTASRALKVLSRLLTVIVLAASGAYMIRYLYAWEWNRAVVSGIIFVGAEVAFIASLIQARLERLERRLSPAQHQAATLLSQRLRPQRAEPRDPFPWLEPERGTFVFVPVLLGAGAILSALAHVVQRIATSTVEPVMARGVALHLAELTPPEGGLVPPPGGDRVPPHHMLELSPPPPPTTWREVMTWTAAAMVGGLLLWGAIDVLADATQARPDAEMTGFATIIELQVEEIDGVAERADADALVVACRPRLPDGASVTRTEAIGEGQVRLTVEPALGRTGSRRYQGCLEDATLDLVDADVMWMHRVPVGAPS